MPIDDDLNVQDDGQKPSVVDAYAERLVMAQMQREAHQRTVCAEIARAASTARLGKRLRWNRALQMQRLARKLGVRYGREWEGS